MSVKRFKYPPIYIGFDWKGTFNLQSATPLFPEGVVLKAEVRANPNAPVLATLTTDNGGIVVVDENKIELFIKGEDSSAFVTQSVVLDIIQTSPSVRHLGIRIQITVEKSVTSAP